MFNNMYAQRLWDVLVGTSPATQAREIPLVVSLCYFSLTIFFGRLLRLAVDNGSPAHLRLYLGDFVVSFMLHACSLENGMIMRYYGFTGFKIILFCQIVWFSLTIKTYEGNPRQQVIGYLSGDRTGSRALKRAACQLAGGLLSYSYARAFWSLELMEGHSQRYKAMHCTSDLKVPILIGFAVEFVGSIIDTFISITTFSSFQFAELLTKCMFTTFMVVMGVDATGFYLNPVNASNQTWGCAGTSHLEHILIYWLGPLAATALTVLARNHVKANMKSLRAQGHEIHQLLQENTASSKQDTAHLTSSDIDSNESSSSSCFYNMDEDSDIQDEAIDTLEECELVNRNDIMLNSNLHIRREDSGFESSCSPSPVDEDLLHGFSENQGHEEDSKAIDPSQGVRKRSSKIPVKT